MQQSPLTNIDYSLEIVNSKKKQYILLAKWLVLMNLLLMFFLLSSSESAELKKKLVIFGFVLPLGGLGIKALMKKKKEQPLAPLYEWWFMSCVAWGVTGYFWLVVANLVLFLLFLFSTRRLLVRFGQEGIRIPALSYPMLSWDKLSHVILKDGLLTIEKKDNSFIQQTIMSTSLPNEIDFNNYCHNQLKNHL